MHFMEKFKPNCYMAPGYSLSKFMEELKQEINGTGTTLEQTYHYVMEQGAMGWLKKSNQEDWIAARNSIPMEEIVEGILHRLKKLHIIKKRWTFWR